MAKPFFGRTEKNQLIGLKRRLRKESVKIIVSGEKKYSTSIRVKLIPFWTQKYRLPIPEACPPLSATDQAIVCKSFANTVVLI